MTADRETLPDGRFRRADLRGRRWIMVALRTVHLVAVIALGALLLGAPASPAWSAGRVAGAVLVSGLAMLVLDLVTHRDHLRTVAGITVVLKLLLVAILAVAPEPLLYWATVVLSGVVSHAPARVRHLTLVPPSRDTHG